MLKKVNINEVLPRVKIKLSTAEKSFEQQWRDYQLNPTLETALKTELNYQITHIILSSIAREKNELYQLMLALRELQEQYAVLQKPMVEKDDPNSTGSMAAKPEQREVLYFEYTSVLLLMIITALLKELDNQIAQLSAANQNLTVQIDTLDGMIQHQLKNLVDEFSRMKHEGILLGAHPRFIELLRDYTLRRSDYGLFHGELGRLISRLHHEEHGVEPHNRIIDSLRNRIHQRLEPTYRLGGEQQELVQNREIVCDNLGQCRRIRREVENCQNDIRAAGPGGEAELMNRVSGIHQELRQLPRLVFNGSRNKDEEEKEHSNRYGRKS